VPAADFQDDAVELLRRILQQEVLQPLLQGVAPATERGQLLLRVTLHVGISLGGGQFLGLGNGPHSSLYSRYGLTRRASDPCSLARAV